MTLLFRTEDYDVHEVEGPHGRITLEARWLSRMSPRITVHQSGDGCIGVAIEHNFLYAGQDKVLRDMLNVFIERRKVAREAWEDARRADVVAGGFYVQMDTSNNGFVMDGWQSTQTGEPLTFMGWPVVKTRGGFPLFKHDIDRVGGCYIVFGPMPQAEAEHVAACAKQGAVVTELPRFVGVHTDG